MVRHVTARAAGTQPAPTITIGGELAVNRLGFGAMRITGPGVWGPPDDPAAAKALLRRAVELGVNLIDTSDSYGPHVSEELIAEALHPYPDGVVIATKGGLTRQGPSRMSPNGRPEYLRSACDGSLRRLRLDSIDLYQLHAVDRDVPYAESVGALAELQREGKIRQVGVSNVTLAELATAREITAIASVQNRYNVADRRFGDVLAECERSGIAFVASVPLDAGDVDARSGPLARIAEDRGVSASQVALAWLLHHSPVLAPIPGTASLKHLEANVAAADLELDANDIAQLDRIRPALKTIRRRLRARAGRAARSLGIRR
jgi:pyridoxine 4-dehydrogenase